MDQKNSSYWGANCLYGLNQSQLDDIVLFSRPASLRSVSGQGHDKTIPLLNLNTGQTQDRLVAFQAFDSLAQFGPGGFEIHGPVVNYNRVRQSRRRDDG